MRKIKFLIVLVSLALLFQACNNKNEPTPAAAPITVTANNFTGSIDENPDNAAVIGTVSARASDGSSLTYTLSNQNVAGALAIDASTGELTVADASAFDFETNPSITATYTASSGTEEANASITITVNDVFEDAILANLTTSKTTYEDASDGDWIIITEAEYDALASNLNSISRVGSPEDKINQSDNTFGKDATVANRSGGLTMPNGSYLFAFKYRAANNIAMSGSKVKQSSTDVNSGYADLGSVLPTTSGADFHYFVLKGSNSPTTSTGYLAVYHTQTLIAIRDPSYNFSRYQVLFGSGDGNTLTPESVSFHIAMQGLSTTEKQW